jgi:hypothetical protein
LAHVGTVKEQEKSPLALTVTVPGLVDTNNVLKLNAMFEEGMKLEPVTVTDCPNGPLGGDNPIEEVVDFFTASAIIPQLFEPPIVKFTLRPDWVEEYTLYSADVSAYVLLG